LTMLPSIVARKMPTQPPPSRAIFDCNQLLVYVLIRTIIVNTSPVGPSSIPC
jgi:hypothetical protein